MRHGRDRILTDDADLADQLDALLDRAFNPRQLWLLFVDPDGSLSDVIVPCDDYPPTPTESVVTDDLGHADVARVLARRAGEITSITGAGGVVLVWERRGPSTFGADELDWAAAMADACRAEGVRLRAQFVLHDGGIRILTPDDYADRR